MKYNKYSKTTKDYLEKVESYLSKKYGIVNPEWEGTLFLLADNLELYNECRKLIKQYGIYDPTTGKKNPLLGTTKDLQATILKQIQHLGLSPYAASKINAEVEDDSEDFIEGLTGG